MHKNVSIEFARICEKNLIWVAQQKTDPWLIAGCPKVFFMFSGGKVTFSELLWMFKCITMLYYDLPGSAKRFKFRSHSLGSNLCWSLRSHFRSRSLGSNLCLKLMRRRTKFLRRLEPCGRHRQIWQVRAQWALTNGFLRPQKVFPNFFFCGPSY